jgi:hypothetical protein
MVNHNEGRKDSAIYGRDIRKVKQVGYFSQMCSIIKTRLNIDYVSNRLIKEAIKDKLAEKPNYDEKNPESRRLREKYLGIISSIENRKKDQIIRFLKTLDIPYEDIPPRALERITQKNVLGFLASAEDSEDLCENEIFNARQRCSDIIGNIQRTQAKHQYRLMKKSRAVMQKKPNKQI